MTGAGKETGEELTEQRERLASLASCEERIRSLRDRECDLEVEHMAAQAALNSATSRLAPTIDPALASSIGHSLENRRDLEERLRTTDEGHGTGRGGVDRRVREYAQDHVPASQGPGQTLDKKEIAPGFQISDEPHQRTMERPARLIFLALGRGLEDLGIE